MPSFTYKRAEIFDQTELFSSRDENAYFPFHFHDFYCVSLIKKGVEVLKTKESEFLAPTGTISITQLNEVHRNYAFGEQSYDYQTLYVNPDLLRHFNGGEPVTALERIIDDPALFQQLSIIFHQQDLDVSQWQKSLKMLATHSTPREHDHVLANTFSLIDELLEQYPDTAIDTDWLAGKFCMSKYHFIRKFKQAKGVTPQVYIVLYRLRKAKMMLIENKQPLNEIAYANGFFDPSHFTNSFKKFFGVPPSGFLCR